MTEQKASFRLRTFLDQLFPGDRLVRAAFLCLLALSAVVTYSAMSRLIVGSGSVTSLYLKHITGLIIGIFTVAFLTNINLTSTKVLGIFALGGGFLAMIGLLIGGVAIGGSLRFTALGQPGELIKIGMIIFAAIMLEKIKKLRDQGEPTTRATVGMTVAMFIFVLPIATQNLSTAAIIALTMALMMFAGGIDWKYILAIAAILGTVAFLVIFIVPRTMDQTTYKKIPLIGKFDRMYTWNSRFEGHMGDAEENIQVTASRIAILRGGWLPKGPGTSHQRDLLPDAHNDYVFAIACEEGGFLTGILITALYLIVFIQAVRYSMHTDRFFRKMLILGAALLIVIQAAVHMAVSVGLMPVTGQPLPLISMGTSSIIVISICFGIILKISALEIADREKLKTEEAASQPAQDPKASMIEPSIDNQYVTNIPDEEQNPVVEINNNDDEISISNDDNDIEINITQEE